MAAIPKAYLEIDDDEFAESVKGSIQCALRSWENLKQDWSLE
jgi:hypothetical protein